MDTRMIDVAIGLALVFAMTSLLTTALQEIWSSWKGVRGKFLYKAVESFVGDHPEFARGLLSQPLIVSLAPQSKNQERRPSYMSADVVVSSLISYLVEHHTGGVRPSTPGELMAIVKPAAQGVAAGHSASGTVPNAEFARALAGLAMGVEHDWPAFEARVGAWYDAVCARATGWFKREVQVTVFWLGLVGAILVNVNPIVIASSLWQDEPLRKAIVSVAEKTSGASAQESKSPAGSTPAASAPAAVNPPQARRLRVCCRRATSIPAQTHRRSSRPR